MSNEAHVESMPVVSRFFFAIACFIMIVFDGVFAADVDRTRRLLPPRSAGPKAKEADNKASEKAADAHEASKKSSTSADAAQNVEESESGVDSSLKDRSPPKPKSIPPVAGTSDLAAKQDNTSNETATEEGAADKFGSRERGALLLLSLLQREGRFVDFLQQDVTNFDDTQVGAAARVVHEGCRRALETHLEIAPIRAEAEGEKTKLEAGYDVQAIKLVGNVSGKPPYKGVVQHRGWRALSLQLPNEVGAHDASVLAQAEVEL